ncbi:hypothetical protein Y1Q_0013663 [Alligator mississippiensis]|uniref:Uncharacterized protein n=1 Tax=Alligator mississippiensis TaxID=8496 RepID=A0A151P3S0_ALLMI|nr:hypothetical protein Y1Q_0013663 [Alligator mississippiensis]
MHASRCSLGIRIAKKKNLKKKIQGWKRPASSCLHLLQPRARYQLRRALESQFQLDSSRLSHSILFLHDSYGNTAHHLKENDRPHHLSWRCLAEPIVLFMTCALVLL